MTNEISPRERYIEGLKTVSFEELLDELQHSAKKLGKYEVFSEHWDAAKDEVEIVRAELIRRHESE